MSNNQYAWLSDIEKSQHLYHFTSFDSFVKIWLSQELLFTDVRKVNDLIEQTIQWNIINPQQIPLLPAIDEGRCMYKQISLTMDYGNNFKGCMSSLMWGHYADKTNGVCIELDFDKLQLTNDCLHAPIVYVNNVSTTIDVPPNLRTRNDVDQWLITNQSRLFFTKQNSWKGENEYRIVSNSKRALSIADAISAIYVAKAGSDTCKFVLSLVKNAVPVKCLSYKDISTGISIPRVSDAAEMRKQHEDVMKEPKNAFNSLREQAVNFYKLHKDDWNFPLILEQYKFNE